MGSLEHLTVGSESCRNVREIAFENLERLQTVSFGDGSFHKTNAVAISNVSNVYTFTVGNRSLKKLTIANPRLYPTSSLREPVGVSDVVKSVIASVIQVHVSYQCLFQILIVWMLI